LGAKISLIGSWPLILDVFWWCYVQGFWYLAHPVASYFDFVDLVAFGKNFELWTKMVVFITEKNIYVVELKTTQNDNLSFSFDET
jgi:hypothetical protein